MKKRSNNNSTNYRSIGSSCTSHSQTINGGEISLKMLNDFETLRPGRTDSSVIKSAGPDPRSRIPRKRTLEKLVSSSSFMEVRQNQINKNLRLRSEFEFRYCPKCIIKTHPFTLCFGRS